MKGSQGHLYIKRGKLFINKGSNTRVYTGSVYDCDSGVEVLF